MNVEELTLADIEGYDPRPLRRGKRLRARCPIHGSDHQQSLSVDTETGWGRCFACGVTVRVSDFIPPGEEKEDRWRIEGIAMKPKARPTVRPSVSPPAAKGNAALMKAAERLRGSPGQTYLEGRGIPLEVAQRYGVGFVGPGAWPGRKAARRWPRVVFPLETPEGVVNWYSRAASVGAPRSEAHDVLSGPKGYFNFAALRREEAVFVCEAALDGLSLATAGLDNCVALIGTQHFRPEWFLAWNVKKMVLALDRDPQGQKAVEEIAWKAAMVGLACESLPAEVYAGEKDLNAALIKVGPWDWPCLCRSALAGYAEPQPGLPEDLERMEAMVEVWREELIQNLHYPDAPENVEGHGWD